jgi:hypothetical protein
MAVAFKSFEEIKRRSPSAEYVEIDIPLKGQPVSLLSTFSPYMGKLNDAEFGNRAAQTLMFMGPKASSGDPRAKLGFVFRPEGWNTAQDPETGEWVGITLGQTGKGPIQLADFSQIDKLIGD